MKEKSRTRQPPEETVEIVDLQDRPLGVLPLAEAHRQHLPHRSVLVLVFDADNRIYLQKRSSRKTLYPGRWDISATGHVRAGESRRDAAARQLEEELRIRAARLDMVAEYPAGPDTGWEFTTLFRATGIQGEPSPNPDEVEGGMYVDADELAALATGFREHMTPALVGCHEAGLVFAEGEG